MKKKYLRFIIVVGTLQLVLLLKTGGIYCQDDVSKITVRSTLAAGSVFMMEGENGFSGGNVAASVGPDGILLVDDMFSQVTTKLLDALKKINDSALVRIVINSHFHTDHIDGNAVLSRSAIIIAHDNTRMRLTANGSRTNPQALPMLTFDEKLTLYFNGEEELLFHLPNGHTDNDVLVYFRKSKVIHMGDTYFNGMFPGVYAEGGGNIRQLIINLDKVLADLPDDIKIIPGHGPLAAKPDLINYVSMLKETTAIVDAGIKSGKTLAQLQEQHVLSKYNQLGDGGGQTTDQYLAMLFRLLSV